MVPSEQPHHSILFLYRGHGLWRLGPQISFPPHVSASLSSGLGGGQYERPRPLEVLDRDIGGSEL